MSNILKYFKTLRLNYFKASFPETQKVKKLELYYSPSTALTKLLKQNLYNRHEVPFDQYHQHVKSNILYKRLFAPFSIFTVYVQTFRSNKLAEKLLSKYCWYYCNERVLSLTQMLILNVCLTMSMHGLRTSKHLDQTLEPLNWITVCHSL